MWSKQGTSVKAGGKLRPENRLATCFYTGILLSLFDFEDGGNMFL
jgi:hypothetical protein